MIFANFDANGRVLTAHNDLTVHKCPDGFVTLTMDQFNDRFNLKLVEGELISSKPETAISQIDICKMVSRYILNTINALPYDYDSVAEVYAWINNPLYGAEAQSLYDWCIECQIIEFNIKIGEIVFDTVESAIDYLPKVPTLIT